MSFPVVHSHCLTGSFQAPFTCPVASVSCACSTLRKEQWGPLGARAGAAAAAVREPGAAGQQGEYQRWQLWEKYPGALLCPSGRRFCFGCCRPGWWDFSVPLHLPSVTLCGTNTFPQLLMLLEAAWALRQQHLLGLCFPTTCAQMLIFVLLFPPFYSSTPLMYRPGSLSSCLGKEGYVCW